MKNLEEQLKKQASSLRLTDTEKRSMRLALADHMRTYPAGPTSNPWLHGMLWRFAMPTFAVFLLFVGTSYAAQGTLPGDLLYKMKIYINEPVQVALTTNPQAKVAVETQLARRRVEEAQTLAARGTLDIQTTQELQENFNAHATEAIALASEAQQKVEATSTASTTVVSVATISSPATTTSAKARIMHKVASPVSELESVLGAQANILDTIKADVGARITKEKEEQKEATSTPPVEEHTSNETEVATTTEPVE